MADKPKRVGTVHIGTSGWHYAHWKGPFYPPGLPNDQMLDFYTQHYATVEINNPFYHVPSAATFAAWRDSTPPAFVFAVKANRRFTHSKKLKDPQPALNQFVRRAATLRDKLGPILFQLPPRWRLNLDRLAEFLRALPPGYRYTVEFRDTSWHTAEVYELLSAHNVAFCIYELNHFRSPTLVTADFAYIRLHGPGAAYQGSYDGRCLSAWARRIAGWRAAGIDSYCYFDNDQAGYAAADAARLQQKIAKLSTTPR